MDDIGALVGMNKVSIYYYFKNKEALFKAMLKREADDYLAKMKREVGKIVGCREKINAWIELSFQYGTSSSVLRQVSMETLKNLTPLLAEFKAWSFTTSVEHVAFLLKEGRQRGEIRSCDTEKVAESIVSFITASKDIANRKFMTSPDRPVNTEQVVKEIQFSINLIFDGLETKVVAPKANRKKKGKV
jgi:AcrR family transcriptional regulator